MRLQPGQRSALLGKRPRKQMDLDGDEKFLELVISIVSSDICVSSDFKTVAGMLHHFAFARLLVC